MDIREIVKHIDKAFDRPGGESWWTDDVGNKIFADVGYAWEWWTDCVRPELLRVFSDASQNGDMEINGDNREIDGDKGR